MKTLPKTILLVAVFSMATLAILGSISTPIFAASTGNQGQPGQTCLSSTAPNEPGNSATAPGSAFNETGGIAGGVYAGNGQNTNTPANGAAVSQYDVACYQVSQSHP